MTVHAHSSIADSGCTPVLGRTYILDHLTTLPPYLALQGWLGTLEPQQGTGVPGLDAPCWLPHAANMHPCTHAE